VEKLSRNLLWMAAANIVSSLFSAGLFIYLARVLEPKGFGYLSYVFAIIFFVANFIDFGLSTYGAREIAREKRVVSAYVSEIISLRIILGAVLALLLVAIAFLSSHSAYFKILIAGSSLILFRIALASEWAFQGTEEMGMVFVSLAANAGLQFGLVYTFVKRPEDMLKVPILYFVATLPVTILLLKRLKFTLMIKREDLARMMSHLSGSLVIWFISIFAQVYNGLDIFMLGLFRRIEEVGYFTIARRVVGEMALLMIFLANALLPRLSSAFGRDAPQFKAATRKFLRLAIILTICAALPIMCLSKWLISLTVGRQYVSASLPLNIMIAGLVLILFNLPYSTGLIAGRLEKEVLKQTAGCALVSIVLNFILMPKYGMIGAAISFVFVEAIALIWIVGVYKKRIGVV